MDMGKLEMAIGTKKHLEEGWLFHGAVVRSGRTRLFFQNIIDHLVCLWYYFKKQTKWSIIFEVIV